MSGEIRGEFGVVSATDRFASAAGQAILEDGGNAFDAAVAAGLVMQVVEPHLSGPAGEVTAVFHPRAEARPRVLCGQGPAPARATPRHFTDAGFGLVPGTGVLSAPVPGAFDAWMLLLRDYGTKPLRQVLEPALGFAEKGHPLLFVTAFRIAMLEGVFRNEWPSSGALYLPGGQAPAAGALHLNRALAGTYGRVLAEAEAAGGDREGQIEAARDAWYRGFVAEEIERFAARSHRDPTHHADTGVITAADLAAYRASYDEPAMLGWRGWTICKPGAWSQGPVFLQQLALLEDAGTVLDELNGGEHAHIVVEAAKLAYADREAFYGDAAAVPLDYLLSREYATRRAGLIGESASWTMRPGSPGGRLARLPALVPESVESVPRIERAIRAAAGGKGAPARGDTCHVAVADRWGNMIAATPSGGFLTNSPVIESLGFPLSTRLEMAWLEDGLPNTLTPGRRPRTTLSPTLALRDGEPHLAFGTPGADQQEQWSLRFFLAVNAGLDLRAAMDLPMWHTNHLASSLCPHDTHLGEVAVEASAPETMIAELRRRGHEVNVRKAGSLSRLCAVGRVPATRELRAAADPRHGQAHACGR